MYHPYSSIPFLFLLEPKFLQHLFWVLSGWCGYWRAWSTRITCGGWRLELMTCRKVMAIEMMTTSSCLCLLQTLFSPKYYPTNNILHSWVISSCFTIYIATLVLGTQKMSIPSQEAIRSEGRSSTPSFWGLCRACIPTQHGLIGRLLKETGVFWDVFGLETMKSDRKTWIFHGNSNEMLGARCAPTVFWQEAVRGLCTRCPEKTQATRVWE